MGRLSEYVAERNDPRRSGTGNFLNMRVRAMFFDVDKIRRGVASARTRWLNWVGGVVRKTARRSIRQDAAAKRRPSPPGQPPFSKTGILRKFIFYGHDRTTDTVVIGPALAGNQSGAPRVLEEGGFAVIGSGRRRRRVHIEPRPYMGPAYRKHEGGMMDRWLNSVRVAT